MVPAKRLRQLNRKITHLFYICPSSAACSTVRGGIYSVLFFIFSELFFPFCLQFFTLL